MRKIVNIVIFSIAGIACILGLVFSAGFDDKSKDKYFAVNKVNEEYPQMTKDLTALTVESLPDYVKKYQDLINSKNTELKESQLQKDIFYTYYLNLKEVGNDQEKFDAFVKEFPNYSSKLFAKATNPQYYTDGFGKVKSVNDLPDYMKTLESEYNVVKQEYLLKNDHLKSATDLLKLVDEINSTHSKNKKEIDLKNLKEAVQDYSTQTTYINIALYLSYFVFFITLGFLAFFFIYHMAKNFKSSIGGLLGLALIVVIAIIGYFVSSGDLTEKAVELQISSSLMKWIGSGLIVFYVLFFGTFLIIAGTMLMNTIKKYR